ncbi:MAG: TerC family protein [Myxococcota bacterium]|nr:TerC family protein [Myxococcota bacterium]
MHTVGTPALWALFLLGLLVALAVDLFVHRRDAPISVRDAALWSAFWVALSALFCAFVYLRFGSSAALAWGTTWLLEKALSVDNLFVFLVIFSAFAVPDGSRHRVLFWGVLGAFVMRAAFIVAGAALVQAFDAVLYLLGAVLLWTSYRMLRASEDEAPDLDRNPFVRLFRRVVPTTTEYVGRRFWVWRDGRWLATPLVPVLIVVETTDLVFAVDSVPAALAVSDDPFIVFTSNALAILGLRTLFFLLHGLVARLRYLRHGLVAVLAFIGGKLLVRDLWHVPVGVSLAVVATCLAASVLASWVLPRPRVPPVAGTVPSPRRLEPAEAVGRHDDSAAPETWERSSPPPST